jgi:hypothetical protein
MTLDYLIYCNSDCMYGNLIVSIAYEFDLQSGYESDTWSRCG